MAGLFQHKGNPYWWLQFRKGGKWHQRSTGLRFKSTLQTREAKELCAEHTLKEFRDQREVSLGLWSEWLLDFFDQRYATKPKTRQRFRTTWRTFQVYFEEFGIDHPSKVNHAVVMDYLLWRLKPHVGVYNAGRNTALFELKMLGIILGEAVKREYCTTNPARGLGLARERPREKPEITIEEERKIRGALVNYPEWMQVSFEIAMSIGCRLHETSIDFKQIDLTTGRVHFNQKGGRIHSTFFPPTVLPLLESLKANWNRKTLELPRSPSKLWCQFFHRLGMKHLSFHCTRVTVVSRLCRAGVPERVAMRFVGHSSTTVHRIYTRFALDDLQPAVQALAEGRGVYSTKVAVNDLGGLVPSSSSTTLTDGTVRMAAG
jgi:site-specific recombinase XerC